MPEQSLNTKTECSVSRLPISKTYISKSLFLPDSSFVIFPSILPDVVTPTQNHAPFAVAGGANVPQLGLAARALEATCVPVLFHGKKQEAVSDLTPTSCT